MKHEWACMMIKSMPISLTWGMTLGLVAMDNPDIYQQALQELKDPRDWRVRQGALDKLKNVGTLDAMTAVASALYDESPHVVQHAAHVLETFGTAAVSVLIEALHAPREIADRPFVVHALRTIGDRSVVPDLLKHLNDQDTSMRFAIVYALQKFPDEHALQPLLELLKEATNNLKAEIATALGRIGNPTAIPVLVPLLYEEDEMDFESQVVRRFASIALGRIQHPEALQSLLQASQSSSGPVRYNAAEGLGLKSESLALERLLEMLKDAYPLTRAMAVGALGRMRKPEVVPDLIAMLDDPDQDVQNFLRSALGDTGDLRVIPHLIARYRSDSLHATSGLYAFASSYWNYDQRQEQAVEEAINEINNSDERVRVGATWLLYVYSSQQSEKIRLWVESGKIKEDFEKPTLFPKVIDILIDLLIDANPDIRLSALEAQLRIADKAAVDNLIRCLEDDDPLIAAKVAEVLAQVNDPKALPALIKVAQSNDPVTRNRAMSAIARLGSSEAEQALIILLEHSDPWTRSSAAFELGKMKSTLAVPKLLEMLSTELNDDVKEWLVISLGYIGDKRATSQLVQLLKNKNIHQWKLRSNLVRALEMLRDENALPALYEVLDQSPELSVAIGAVDAIAHTGNETEGGVRLFNLLEHKEDSVRTEASRQLGYMGANSSDLDLRDYIVENLIARLQDTGVGFHAAPYVAHAAAKSLYYIGTTEAIQALKTWKLKSENSDSSDS